MIFLLTTVKVIPLILATAAKKFIAVAYAESTNL